MANTEGKLLSLQTLRAIAALMVCCFHLQYFLMKPDDAVPFANGWIGVQVFFVISGFIMYHSNKKDEIHSDKSPFQFLLNRAIRIVPLYLLVSIVQISDNLSGAYLQSHAGVLIRSVLFIPQMTSTLGPHYGFPVLEVGWTLNYEMYFYFLFFLSLFFKQARHALLLITFAIAGIGIPLILLNYFSPDYFEFHSYAQPLLNFYCNPIIILFAAGVMTGLLIDRFKFGISFGRSVFFGSLILFTFYISGIAAFPVNLITDLMIIVPMVAGAIICDQHDYFIFGFKKISVLGDISYSLYLWHPIVVAYLRTTFNFFGINYLNWSWTTFISGIAISIVIAWLSYRFFELRVARFLKNKLMNSSIDRVRR